MNFIMAFYMGNELEYEYISSDQFADLMGEFYRKLRSHFSPDRRLNSVDEYHDSMIYVRSRIRLDADYLYDTINAKKWIYRVDRKRFHDSSDRMLKDYPNIVYSLGKYPDYQTLVKYSREVGYIVPHIKRLINDDKYFKQEQAMYLLLN